jgi:hypothetical protein
MYQPPEGASMNTELPTNRHLLATMKRATIIKILHASENGVPLPATKILENEEIQNLKFTLVVLTAFLSTMKTAGLIDSVSIVGSKYVGYVPINTPKVKAEADPLAKVVTKAVHGKPSLKIDFLKKSGRVRLEFGGLFFEIGVLDE